MRKLLTVLYYRWRAFRGYELRIRFDQWDALSTEQKAEYGEEMASFMDRLYARYLLTGKDTIQYV